MEHSSGFLVTTQHDVGLLMFVEFEKIGCPSTNNGYQLERNCLLVWSSLKFLMFSGVADWTKWNKAVAVLRFWAQVCGTFGVSFWHSRYSWCLLQADSHFSSQGNFHQLSFAIIVFYWQAFCSSHTKPMYVCHIEQGWVGHIVLPNVNNDIVGLDLQFFHLQG